MTRLLSFDKEQRQKLRHKQIAANRQAAAPIVEALIAEGFHVQSIADLVNKRQDYKKAIPLLMHWLENTSNEATKKDLARALAVPWAKPTAAPGLIREFLRSCDQSPAGLKWVLGNALEVVADDSVFDAM